MDFGIADKKALVTGAARGIGRAEAQALAAEGVALAINDIDAAAALAWPEAPRQNGGRALRRGAAPERLQGRGLRRRCGHAGRRQAGGASGAGATRRAAYPGQQ